MGALRSNKPLDCGIGSQGRCFRDDFSESDQQNPVLRISLQSVVQSDLFVPQSTSGRVSQHLLSDVGLPCGCSEFKAFAPATAKKFPPQTGKRQAACQQTMRSECSVSVAKRIKFPGIVRGYERGLSPIPKAQNSEPVSAICWEALRRH